MRRATARLLVCAAIAVAASGTLAGRGQVFRSAVDLVTVNIAVAQHGKPVDGLTAADFVITDNGVTQTILDVGREALPIDVTLVVDMTGGGADNASLVAAVNRLREHLQPEDRARVITFDPIVREEVPLTSARNLPVFSSRPGSRGAFDIDPLTTCYDAITLSLLTPPVADRRELAIVLSAGRDAASLAGPTATLDVARRSSTAVFVVRTVFNPAPTMRPPDGTTPRALPASMGPLWQDPALIPRAFFNELADTTGGRVQEIAPTEVLRSDSERTVIRTQLGKDLLRDAFVNALDEFRASYLVRYGLHGVPRTGWHALKVQITRPGGFDIRARKGYQG